MRELIESVSEKKKPPLQAVVFSGSKSLGNSKNRGNWLVRGAQSPKLSFQCSLNGCGTSRLQIDKAPLNQLPMATAIGDSSCLYGLDARVCYRTWRGSPLKRGVRANQQAWSEPPKQDTHAQAVYEKGQPARQVTASANW